LEWRWLPPGFTERNVRYTGMYISVLASAYTPTFSADELRKANSGAYIRFAKALKAKRQHMSGMTFLGEFRETVKLILAPGKATQKYFSGYLTRIQPLQGKLRLARLDPKRIGSILREASDLWLEVAFGVRPLLADVKDIAESIARWRIDRLSDMVRASDGSNAISGSSFSPVSAPGVNWVLLTPHSTEVRDWRYTVYGRLKASAQLPACGSAAKLVQVLGFSGEDFLPSLYELAPFSFLVDYFTNLGGVIEAASVDTSWVDWANEVLILKGTMNTWSSLSAAPSVSSQVTAGDTMFGSDLSTYHQTNRRAADFSAPAVVSSLPGLGNQFANMLALIAQVRLSR
jgi:hypothetical protein